ncbi:unnamed protein product [Rotaria sp. Silwood1]|nr:unnamed protein product [Rotaria sp. Silwood1]CAF1651206.1 unnamed protein product [Rotaria sp. Silwood1]
MIGFAQVIAGAILIALGLVNIGGAVLSEAIYDMIYAIMADLSETLASAGNTAAKLGSVSRTAMMTKLVEKTAGQYATTCLTNIITENIMEEIQEGVI